MATLVLMRGGQPQVRFRLGEKSTLGRSSSCEVQILDPSLSRHHASILCQDGSWSIQTSPSLTGS